MTASSLPCNSWPPLFILITSYQSRAAHSLSSSSSRVPAQLSPLPQSPHLTPLLKNLVTKFWLLLIFLSHVIQMSKRQMQNKLCRKRRKQIQLAAVNVSQGFPLTLLRGKANPRPTQHATGERQVASLSISKLKAEDSTGMNL